MNSKYPIMWYQGAPIGPEHFQQDFLYKEDQRKLTLSYILKNNWGIKKLEFDESELDQGILKVKKLIAITQNYSLIEISEEEDIMIDLSLYKEELKDQSLFLYLSFPNNELTEQPNVNNPKYKEIIQEVSDLNNKEEKVTLKFLKPNYFLEVAKTQSLKNISLPIAKLTYNGMNYKLIDYCPPITELSNSKILVEDLIKLISIIKDKVNFLKNTKKTLENYILLSNLSSILFPLEKNLKNNDHPYEIYNGLIYSLSFIFNFTKDNKLPTIPEYKHENILGPFKELINYIYENISDIKVTCLQKQFLKQIDKNTSLFSIEAPQKIKNNMIIIGVERNKAASYQDMQQWIEESTIATIDKITDTQLQRTLGTKRFLIKNFDELDVPKIDNLIIFGIETNNHYMTPNESLCILNMNKKTAIPEAIFLIENN